MSTLSYCHKMSTGKEWCVYWDNINLWIFPKLPGAKLDLQPSFWLKMTKRPFFNILKTQDALDKLQACTRDTLECILWKSEADTLRFGFKKFWFQLLGAISTLQGPIVISNSSQHWNCYVSTMAGPFLLKIWENLCEYIL